MLIDIELTDFITNHITKSDASLVGVRNETDKYQLMFQKYRKINF